MRITCALVHCIIVYCHCGTKMPTVNFLLKLLYEVSVCINRHEDYLKRTLGTFEFLYFQLYKRVVYKIIFMFDHKFINVQPTT